MLEVLSIGDMVEPGTYRRFSSHSSVANFTDGTRVVSLALPGVDPGPLNVIVRGFAPHRVLRVRVDPDAVLIDGTSVGFDRRAIYTSSVTLLRRDVTEFRMNLEVLGSALLEQAPPESLAFLLDRPRADALRFGFEHHLSEHIRVCVRDILFWNRERGVRRLSGCGVGLTPAGDDFIAGFLLGLVVLERLGLSGRSGERERVLRWAGRKDPLNASFLWCASGGFAFRSMRELISALDLGPGANVRSWTERLLQIGATSGADMGVGLYMTASEGLAGRLKECPRAAAAAHALHEGARLWS